MQMAQHRQQLSDIRFRCTYLPFKFSRIFGGRGSTAVVRDYIARAGKPVTLPKPSQPEQCRGEEGREAAERGGVCFVGFIGGMNAPD